MKRSLKLLKLISVLLLLPLLVSCKVKEDTNNCVIFDTNGGNSLSKICVSNGFQVLTLPTPKKNNFVFEGWYDEEDVLVEAPFIFEWDTNIILYAKWSEEVTIGTEGLVYELSGDNYIVKSYSGTATNVNIPSVYNKKNVVRIGYLAFNGNTVVTSIGIPSSVQSIDDYAFYGCIKLTNVIIYGGLTRIGMSAFAGCTGIKDMILPSSLTTIENNAFDGCKGLVSIKIQGSLTRLGNKSFANCTSLQSITIPISAISMGDLVFEGCTSLTSVIFSTTPSVLTSLGNWTFKGCTSLTDIIIPISVTSVGEGTFYECASLKNIIIPSSVTKISSWTFYHCTSLTDITIHRNINNLGISAFEGCSALTRIVVPVNVLNVEDYAFRNCNKLTIYSEAHSKPNSWSSYWNSSNCPVIWNYAE